MIWEFNEKIDLSKITIEQHSLHTITTVKSDDLYRIYNSCSTDGKVLLTYRLDFSKLNIEYTPAYIKNSENSGYQPIGSCTVHYLSSKKVMIGVFVRSNYRRDKIGSFLLDYNKDRLKKAGFNKLVVHALSDGQQKFFTKNGFVKNIKENKHTKKYVEKLNYKFDELGRTPIDYGTQYEFKLV